MYTQFLVLYFYPYLNGKMQPIKLSRVN